MYKIVITNYFKKQLKQLLKKNRNLKNDFKKALLSFNKNNSLSIGKGVYKLRIKAQSKGKSGGYRLFVFLIEIESILAPICIYSKSTKENLTYEELIHHLIKTKEELLLLL